MASTITLNTIPIGIDGVNSFIDNINLFNNTVLASTLREIVVDSRFSTLFQDGSINPSKLAPIPGDKILSMSLSGSNDLTFGGQIARYSIGNINLGDQIVDSRTVIDRSISNRKLEPMLPFSIKANTSDTEDIPEDLIINQNSVVGRFGIDNVASLSANDNSILRRKVGEDLGFGRIDEDFLEDDSKFLPGMIMMWSGSISSIPQGWGLCNGEMATYRGRVTNKPDLRNKFIVGASLDVQSEAQTNVSGVATKTGGNIAHSHHIISVNEDVEKLVINSLDNAQVLNSTYDTDNANHIPPYFALAFIIKL